MKILISINTLIFILAIVLIIKDKNFSAILLLVSTILNFVYFYYNNKKRQE